MLPQLAWYRCPNPRCRRCGREAKRRRQYLLRQLHRSDQCCLHLLLRSDLLHQRCLEILYFLSDRSPLLGPPHQPFLVHRYYLSALLVLHRQVCLVFLPSLARLLIPSDLLPLPDQLRQPHRPRPSIPSSLSDLSDQSRQPIQLPPLLPSSLSDLSDLSRRPIQLHRSTLWRLLLLLLLDCLADLELLERLWVLARLARRPDR